MKKYFLYYNEQDNVNYCFLFGLFSIAEQNKSDKLNNIITYSTLQELSNRINSQCNYKISTSTISRIITDSQYQNYFTKSSEEKKITLNTNFKENKHTGKKFVVLTDKEIKFLLEQDNKLLNKYYLYLKYYCGYSKSKKIDTTANQILSAIGYSSNCGNNKNSLCKFNTLLAEKGFLNITKEKDSQGYNRNIYSMNL